MGSIRKTALHESAHLITALVCHRLPQPVGVSVRPGADGSLGRVRGRLRFDRPTLSRELLAQAVAVRLSGFCAEERAGWAVKDLRTSGSRGDLRDVAELLTAHGCKGREADALVERGTAKAMFLVSDLWPVILQLASWLESAGELDETAVAKARMLLGVYLAAETRATERLLHGVSVLATEYRAHSSIERVRKASASASRRRA